MLRKIELEFTWSPRYVVALSKLNNRGSQLFQGTTEVIIIWILISMPALPHKTFLTISRYTSNMRGAVPKPSLLILARIVQFY